MNQVIVITGAATGLGLRLAERFVARGDLVYGLTRSERHWPQARNQIRETSRFQLERVDLCSEAQVKRFFAKLGRRRKRLDILINNAGYGGRLRELEKETLREFQRHLSSNLLSTFLVCKYALPLLKRRKGAWVLNIASYAGKRAVPSLGAYSASKFGVVALTQSFAKENLERRIRWVTVCPGGMNTPMREKLFGRDEAKRQQSPDFVADKILEIVEGKIKVESGGDIVIRHGRLTAVNPPPPA